jgi:hypothetical protein
MVIPPGYTIKLNFPLVLKSVFGRSLARAFIATRFSALIASSQRDSSRVAGGQNMGDAASERISIPGNNVSQTPA